MESTNRRGRVVNVRVVKEQQQVAEQQAVAQEEVVEQPKKPRRGRPPKKTVEAVKDASEEQGGVELTSGKSEESKAELKRRLQRELAEAKDVVFVEKLTREIKENTKSFSRSEIKALVKLYHIIQKQRIAAYNMMSGALGDDEVHTPVLGYLTANLQTLELRIAEIFDVWTKAHPVGAWLRSIRGVGPVMAASLIAYIDVSKATSATKVWAYAGLVPGQRETDISWNRDFRTLCYLISEGLVKAANPSVKRYLEKVEKWNLEHPENPKKPTAEDLAAVEAAWMDDSNLYGRLYRERKEYETAKNERGDYADQAKVQLETKSIKNAEYRKCLESGKLMASHINARCHRYIVKMLLSHTFEMMCECEKGEPPVPYAIAHLNHVDYVPIPNYDVYIEDIRKARGTLA